MKPFPIPVRMAKPVVPEETFDTRRKFHLDGTKIAHPAHAERLRAFLAGERVAPITMDMALTQKCQAACTFCYADLQQRPEDPVPWEVWERFLWDCTEIGHKRGEGVKAISLVSDGESTLSKSYYRFIRTAKDLGIDVASGTNGEALKPEELPMLVRNLSYLRINLNAATAEANGKIMGYKDPEKSWARVIGNVREMVRLKRELNAPCTIGLQMVLMPHYGHEAVKLARLGRDLGVDYLVLKHCSDDEVGRLGVDYSWYVKPETMEMLHEAEAQSTASYQVQVKWSKIKTGRDRQYSRCYGTPLHLQISGTGLVAPCGSFFSDAYKQYHIGHLLQSRFKDIWKSDKYTQVINHLKSDAFDPRKMCATLCLQDRTNKALYDHIDHGKPLPPVLDRSAHVNFL